MTNADMVQEFHDRFGVDSDKDLESDPKLIELRLKLIAEEYREVCDAFVTGTRYDIAKELCDLLYVTYGTLITFGMNPNRCFAEVHKSNMTKLDKDGKPVYHENGKVKKSDQYIEADLTDIF